MPPATTSSDFTDAERGLVKGIALMVLLKVVIVGWIGLDMDAWYVWPWSWLAFAWMVPWIAELVDECRGQ
jgi:hypothetical protein